MSSGRLIGEAEELRRLRAFVRDLAEDGLRGIQSNADEMIRQRAREALAGTISERMRVFAAHVAQCDACADWQSGGPDPSCVDGNKIHRGEG